MLTKLPDAAAEVVESKVLQPLPRKSAGRHARGDCRWRGCSGRHGSSGRHGRGWRWWYRTRAWNVEYVLRMSRRQVRRWPGSLDIPLDRWSQFDRGPGRRRTWLTSGQARPWRCRYGRHGGRHEIVTHANQHARIGRRRVVGAGQNAAGIFDAGDESIVSPCFQTLNGEIALCIGGYFDGSAG